MIQHISFVICKGDISEFDLRDIGAVGKNILSVVTEFLFFKYRLNAVQTGIHNRQACYLPIEGFQWSKQLKRKKQEADKRSDIHGPILIQKPQQSQHGGAAQTVS